MIERMGMDPDIVPNLRRQYWTNYGTTSRGLELLHDLDVEDYMQFVHDLELSEYIGPNPALDVVLSAMPQTKIIFTNATAEHAEAVLKVVGVRRHFSAIYDAFFCENEAKPAESAYRRLLTHLGAAGSRCIMVEDTARNLRPAKALGMTTVLVDPPVGADVDGADHIIQEVAEIGDIVAGL
jgi:putative hydrolase of the HAD superfamily